MNLFEVYKLWDIEPVKGLDTTLWDKNGEVYTDLYGGHAVISVGHCHPHYVKRLTEQAGQLGFYSNAVKNSLQKELAEKLGKICGYDDYAIYSCPRDLPCRGDCGNDYVCGNSIFGEVKTTWKRARTRRGG